MDDSAFDDYLAERYEYEMRWYGRRARQNQLGYRTAQLYGIVAAVSIPVLLQIDSVDAFWTAALAGSVAAAQGISVVFNFHENWLNYRTTRESLKKEIYFMRAGVGEYAEAEDVRALFVRRVEALISRENTIWLTTAGRRDDQSGRKEQ